MGPLSSSKRFKKGDRVRLLRSVGLDHKKGDLFTVTRVEGTQIYTSETLGFFYEDVLDLAVPTHPFKAGDKVVAIQNSPSHLYKVGDEFVVRTTFGVGHDIRLAVEERPNSDYFARNFKFKEETSMTTTVAASELKVGDKITVTIEATVRRITEAGDIRVSSTRTNEYLGLARDHQVKVLRKPLPTTSGSLIKDKGTGKLFVLSEAGDWLSLSTGNKHHTSYIEVIPYEIVHTQ